MREHTPKLPTCERQSARAFFVRQQRRIRTNMRMRIRHASTSLHITSFVLSLDHLHVYPHDDDADAGGAGAMMMMMIIGNAMAARERKGGMVQQGSDTPCRSVAEM